MMKKQQKGGSTFQRNAAIEGLQWEMRPGGMLVQKRNSEQSPNPNPQIKNADPTIGIRVKHDSNLHDIKISRHASFGELKKALAGKTGVHPEDQKLMFREKERESKQYLDIVGVKEGSRLVVMEDVMRKERRFLEIRRSAAVDKGMKSVAEITMEVDKLAEQVGRMMRKGSMAGEKEVLVLVEQMMSQLIKLDGIAADGEIKMLRKKQVVRVQRYIEILDKLKAQNEAIQQRKKVMSNMGEKATLFQRYQYQPQEEMNKIPQVPKLTSFASQQVATTTKWEKF